MSETWDFSMPLEEAMTTQRALRRLKPDMVDDALVLRLIELAVKAPSGSNAQNWEFIMVRDPDVKARLARRNRQACLSGNGGSNGGQSAVKNHPNGSQSITRRSQDPK